MNLEERFDSIKTIEAFCTLLNKVKVSVDWHGRRLASAEGYEGVVTIEAIARKFLNFPHFVQVEPKSTLVDRLGLCVTWERIEKLYQLSNECLQNTHLYRFALPAVETAAYYSRTYPTSLDIILGLTPWGKEEHIFQFKPLEFAQLWPNIQPKKVIYLVPDNPMSIRIIATKEMVKARSIGNSLS